MFYFCVCCIFNSFSVSYFVTSLHCSSCCVNPFLFLSLISYFTPVFAYHLCLLLSHRLHHPVSNLSFSLFLFTFPISSSLANFYHHPVTSLSYHSIKRVFLFTFFLPLFFVSLFLHLSFSYCSPLSPLDH